VGKNAKNRPNTHYVVKSSHKYTENISKYMTELKTVS